MEHDKFTPSALILIGIIFLIYSFRYSFGSTNQPGDAFFPFLCAAVLVGLSSVLLGKHLRSAQKDPNSQAKQEPVMVPGKVYMTIVVMVLFAILHNVLGFWVSIFGVMVGLNRIAGISSWKWSLLGGGVVVVIAYLLFNYWMGAYFPKGAIRLSGILP